MVLITDKLMIDSQNDAYTILSHFLKELSSITSTYSVKMIIGGEVGMCVRDLHRVCVTLDLRPW